ncbi:enoyl-CoA hydratase/carnithine racemase [Hymenopellis radicata]|nr:enoyl-CoA hydratase/carnithine racemase [Hymenopellis radicata]
MSPTPPAHASTIILSFPSSHVLLLTFNRPDALNSVTPDMRKDLERVLDWFEAEDELWVLVLTGTGRIFCSGVDLKDWSASLSPTSNTERDDQQSIVNNPHGFASLSRRMTAKPIVAAVNGGAYGGGMEVVLNCDLVVADEKAKFALPEVRRGVSALQGGIPRLVDAAGRQRAAEMLLLGRTVSAQEAYDKFHFVTHLIPAAKPSNVLPTALSLAQQIVEQCSPDAVQATKRAMLSGYDIEKAVMSKEVDVLFGRGSNMGEGLKAFVEKRAPVWRSAKSKL